MVIMPQLEDNAQVPDSKTIESKQGEVKDEKVLETEDSRKSSDQSDIAESISENGQPVEAVAYQPETVDFPASPQPRKRLNVPENTFKDPLTNFAEEDISQDDSSSSTFKTTEPYSLDRQRWLTDYSADEYFEDSLLPNTNTPLPVGSPPLHMQEWTNGTEPYSNGFNTPRTQNNQDRRFSFSDEHESREPMSMSYEPMSLQSQFEPVSLQSNCEPISFQSTIGPASLQSTCSEGPDLKLLDKIKDCFDQEKIKDLYVLSGRLQDMLSPMEIEEIVMNSELYTSYIDDDMFEVFSAAHAELSSTLSRGGSIRDSRRKIRATVNPDVQEDITIKAVFQCHTSSLRNSMRIKKNLPKAENIKKIFEDNPSRSIAALSKVKEPDSIAIPSELQPDDPNKDSIKEKEESVGPAIAENQSEAICVTDPEMPKMTPPAERPETLPVDGGQAKRKIRINTDILNSGSHDNDEDQKSLSSISNKSDVDVLSPIEDLATPDDIETPEDIDDSVFDKLASTSEMIPELSAIEELQEERSWKTCLVAGVEQKIDMKVIEPYKKVLSHGGYYGPDRHAIIVFSACFLPDHGRRDYDYVMDNLFFYVLTTLEQLVAEDYILVYLHGATDKNNMPTFGWLKRCYQMIDRRLRKNLKGLYLVHPTFWLKTIVIMTRPFISSKFYRKLKFVNCLRDLSDLIPLDHVCIPDKVKQYEETYPELTQ